MVICDHKTCGYEDRVWLYLDESGHASDLMRHPWCIKCGLVKNISDDRPKKVGYWINILSRIVKHFSISQCQKRLIIREIQTSEYFTDLYGITGSTQKKLFLKIIEKYCRIPSHVMYTLVY
jgi:hypothetical protein